jgi:hypothetical protein
MGKVLEVWRVGPLQKMLDASPLQQASQIVRKETPSRTFRRRIEYEEKKGPTQD